MNIYFYLLVLLFVYLFLRYFISGEFSFKKIKLISITLVILLTLFAFSSYPKGTASFPAKGYDLFRYYFQIENMRDITFSSAKSFIFEKVWFLFRIIEFIVAKVSSYNNLLFFITIPITVGIFLYIVYDINKENRLSKNQIIISIFFFLSIINPLHLFSGIRNALAVSIFALGFYDIKMKNKKIGYIYYLISFLIHPMIIIFIILDIIYPFLKRLKFANVLLLLFIFIFPFLPGIISELNSIIYIPSFILDKVSYYSLENNYYNTKVLMLELIQLLMLFIIIYRAEKTEYNKNIRWFYYLSFLAISVITQSTYFIRVRFMFTYFLPYIFSISNLYNINNKRKEFIMLIISMVIFIYYFIEFFQGLGVI